MWPKPDMGGWCSTDANKADRQGRIMKTAPPEEFSLNRIRLRRHLLSDVDSIYKYASNLEVAKYADWPVRSQKESLIQAIELRSINWELGLEYSWVITLLENDTAIGGISVFINGSQLTLGYLLHPDYWGMGITIEASQAIIKWLSSAGEVSKIQASCDTENIASIRVLEKLGFNKVSTEIESTVRPQISNVPRDTHVYEYITT